LPDLTRQRLMSKYSLMARRTTISSEQILKAARKVFLEKGFGAATADIAREAGVSEGSLFKRFATKVDLFRAAMGLPEFHLEHETSTLVGKGDVKDNLARLMTRIIEFHRELFPRVVMMWSQPGLNPLEILRSHGDHAPPRQAVKALACYLEGEMDAGRLGRRNPETVAGMIMSSIHSYVFLEKIGLKDGDEDESQRYIRSVLDVLWEGISP